MAVRSAQCTVGPFGWRHDFLGISQGPTCLCPGGITSTPERSITIRLIIKPPGVEGRADDHSPRVGGTPLPGGGAPWGTPSTTRWNGGAAQPHILVDSRNVCGKNRTPHPTPSHLPPFDLSGTGKDSLCPPPRKKKRMRAIQLNATRPPPLPGGWGRDCSGGGHQYNPPVLWGRQEPMRGLLWQGSQGEGKAGARGSGGWHASSLGQRCSANSPRDMDAPQSGHCSGTAAPARGISITSSLAAAFHSVRKKVSGIPGAPLDSVTTKPGGLGV